MEKTKVIRRIEAPVRMVPVVTRLLAAISAGLLLSAPAGAETQVKQGSPRVTFVSFSLQSEAIQGELVRASAFFQLTSPVEVNEKVFFHLVKAGQNDVLVNADFFPRLPVPRWEVGQVVEAGPIGLYVPYDLEPGDYEVRAGLMEIVREETGVRFVREPYTNPDIKNFTVGKIAVKPAPQREGEAGKPTTELELVKFTADQDLLFWEPRGATIALAKEGDQSMAMVTIKPEGQFPGIVLGNYFNILPSSADWSGFDMLELVLKGASDADGRLFLQVNDRGGRMFKKEINLKGKSELKEIVSLVDAGGVIDLSSISQLRVFQYRPNKEFTFYISMLHLLARGASTGAPAVTFVRLQAPERVKRGEVFKVTCFFKLIEPVFAPHKMFLHVYRQHDLKGWKGTDVPLSPPLRSWPLNQEIAVESGPMMLDPADPPGTYVVQSGLYMIADTSGGGLDYVKVANWDEYAAKIKVAHETQPVSPIDYIKQPYTNLEIKGWEVGTIKVE